MNTTLSTAGRIIYALIMLLFGIFHFLNGEVMQAYVPSFIPGGIFWVYLTGAALVLAAVAILLKKKSGMASLLLGVMLVIFALTIWLPNITPDGPEMSMMLKDIGLAAAAFMISGNSKN